MIIKFDNTSLKYILTEEAILAATSVVGSNVTLKLDDNNGLVDDDFVVVGALLSPRTKIAQINDIVVAGTDIRVDSMLFSHNPTDLVQKVAYNQVRLYNAATEIGAKTLLATLDLDVDQRWTNFTVSDATSGFLFFALYNSATTTLSEYSAAIPISTAVRDFTKTDIRKFVEIYYKDTDLSDEKLTILTDKTINEIYAMRNWRFREGTATFTIVAGQTVYDIKDDLNIADFGSLLSARTPNLRLHLLNSDEDDILSMNPVTMLPNAIFEWADNLHVYVTGGVTITIKYYKRPESFIDAVSKTGIKLIGAIGYGILKDLFLPKDTDLSSRFGNEYLRAIKLLVKDDEAYAVKISSLPDSDMRVKDVTPNIIAG